MRPFISELLHVTDDSCTHSTQMSNFVLELNKINQLCQCPYHSLLELYSTFVLSALPSSSRAENFMILGAEDDSFIS